MAQDTVSVVVKADSSSVRGATGDLNKFSAAGGGAKSAMRALLPALTAVVSVRAFAGMAKEATDFGSALAEVSTLLGDFSDMPRIEQEAKNLAAAFGGNATDQAKGFYQAISAGASNAEEATKLMTVANRLAIGGVTDVTTAVDGLTSIMNAFGVESENVTGISDALFVAMKAGKTTVGELSASVGKVSAIASEAGLSFEEMLATVSTLTTAGINTAEAVTGLKAALTNILKPSKAASDLAAELGIEFNLAGLESKGFQGFLADLVEQTKGNKDALIELFGSTEALNTVFALTGSGAQTFADILKDMDDKAGETETAFQKMAGTIEQRMAVVKGSLSNTRVEVGNLFLALSMPLLDALEDNIGAFNQAIIDLSNTIFTFIQTEQFTTWMTALGTGFEVLTTLIVTKFIVGIGISFISAVSAASGALGVLGAAVSFLGGPVTLAIGAITALTVAIGLLVDTPINSYMKELEAAAAQGIGPVEEHIASLQENITRLNQEIAKGDTSHMKLELAGSKMS